MWMLIFLFKVAFSQGIPVEAGPGKESEREAASEVSSGDDLAESDPKLKWLDSVVMVVQGSSTCAGTFINEKGWVATAYHCVASGGRPGIQTQDGRRTVGRVIQALPSADIAVIDVSALAGEPHVPISQGLPDVTDPITVIGHPFGARPGAGFMAGTLRWSVAGGVISSVGMKALQISAPLNPGNSGGPVLNESGELVGIVSRRLAGQGVGFATRSAALRALLENPKRMSAVGGTISLHSFAALWTGEWGVASFGGQLDIAVRDRVVLSVGAAGAPSGRWVALQRGQSRWSMAEARLGLRQRILRGPWSSHVEIFGGGAAVREVRINWRNGGDGFNADYFVFFRPMFGGALRIGAWAVDAALIQDGDNWAFRTSVVLRWPGGLAVF